MDKTVIICLVKVLSVVNNWDFVSLLIDAYLNDIPYCETIMRNAYGMMIHLKCRLIKKLSLPSKEFAAIIACLLPIGFSP